MTLQNVYRNCNYSLLIFLIILLLPFCAQADDMGFLPPLPKPIRVGVGLFINNINYINDNKSQVELTATIHTHWEDPRLAFKVINNQSEKIFTGSAAEQQATQIWTPYLDILRRDDVTQLHQSILIINSDGHVDFLRKVGLTLDLDLNVSRFPFDQQKLNITILPFAYSNTLVELYKIPSIEGIMPNIQIPNWTLSKQFESKIINIYYKVTNSQHYAYEATLTFTRDSFPYVVQVLAPLFLISLMCYVMLFTPIRPGDNFQVLITIILAMIAFQWLILGVVPGGSYINLTSALIFISFVFCCSVMIFLSFLEIFEKTHGREVRFKLDIYARIILLIAYFAAIGISIAFFFR